MKENQIGQIEKERDKDKQETAKKRDRKRTSRE